MFALKSASDTILPTKGEYWAMGKPGSSQQLPEVIELYDG